MADKEACLIGRTIAVRGHISGKQDLVVEGRVEGNITLDSRLSVEAGGVIEADVEVTEAVVRGELKGTVVANRLATIHAGGHLTGTLRAPRVVIEDGARFDGMVEMDVDLPAGVGLRA